LDRAIWHIGPNGGILSRGYKKNTLKQLLLNQQNVLSVERNLQTTSHAGNVNCLPPASILGIWCASFGTTCLNSVIAPAARIPVLKAK